MHFPVLPWFRRSSPVGLPMALLYIFMCIALCLMIIGLPYAKTLLQHALLCLRPYGSELR